MISSGQLKQQMYLFFPWPWYCVQEWTLTPRGRETTTPRGRAAMTPRGREPNMQLTDMQPSWWYAGPIFIPSFSVWRWYVLVISDKVTTWWFFVSVFKLKSKNYFVNDFWLSSQIIVAGIANRMSADMFFVVSEFGMPCRETFVSAIPNFPKEMSLLFFSSRKWIPYLYAKLHRQLNSIFPFRKFKPTVHLSSRFAWAIHLQIFCITSVLFNYLIPVHRQGFALLWFNW